MVVALQRNEHDTPLASSNLDRTMAEQVMSALSDVFSRKIIASVIEKGKTVQEISTEQTVPLSTCYRRCRELVDEGILFVETIVVTGDGKRYAIYRSSFRGVEVSSDFHGVTVKAEVSNAALGKFQLRRLMPSDSLSDFGMEGSA